MKDWSWSRVAITGTCIVAAIWVAGPLLIWGLGERANGSVSDFGAAGDMFGSSTSLFSGLGLLGVALVLYHDMRERRIDLRDRQEVHRPLLLPDISDGGGATLNRAAPNGRFMEVLVTLDIPIVNATDEAALNVDLTAISSAGSPSLSVVVDLDNAPIAGRKEGKAQVRFDAAGTDAESFLAMIADGGVVVEVRVAYDSVNGVRWASDVQYEMRGRSADNETLKKIRDPDSGVTVGTSDAPMSGGIPLETTPVRNSWKQLRLPSNS